MNIQIRHLSTVLALSLLTGLPMLAGCGGGDDETPGTPPETAANGGESLPPGGPDPAARDEQGYIIPFEAMERPAPLRTELGEFFSLIEAYRTGAARVRIRKHMNLHPGDGQAHFLFGLSYHRERQYNQAIPYFETALELEPQYDNTWHFMGWALYYEGQAERARQMFEQHLRFTPEADDSHFALGLLDLDAGELKEAASHFSTALELLGETPGREKERAKSMLGLADVAIARDDLPAARQKILESIDEYDQSFESWARLSRVEARLGNEAAAEEARQRSETLRQQAEAARPATPSAPPAGRDDG